ncbi:MAG: hypothetical protein HFJ81_02230 [Clostridia bacterium]|nr:hypothetical protein [Clostridia bacterium]
MEYDFRTNIILIADDFYEAFKRCREGKNPVQDGNVVKCSVCNVPAIVNGAFALELYFKSMLSPDTDGHKLMDLFNSFEENIKQEIKEKSISKLEKLAWGKSFEQYLEDINNVFVDWRYIHEKNYNVKYLSNGANEFLQVLSILLPVISEIARKYAIVNDI